MIQKVCGVIFVICSIALAVCAFILEVYGMLVGAIFYGLLACFAFMFAKHKKQKTNIKSDIPKETLDSITVKPVKLDVPKETLNAMKSVASSIDVGGIVRIIDDSYKIIHNTKDISTLCSRHEVALQKSYTLKQMELAGIYTGKPSADYYISLLHSEYYDCMKQCYYKNLDDAKKTLKTNKGVQNRMNAFWNKLSECVVEDVVSDLKEMIEDEK